MPLSEKLEGLIVNLYRYPVKSMRREELNEAVVEEHGIKGDRVYAFSASIPTANPPWFTGRDAPEMLLLKPEIIGYTAFPVSVKLPDGSSMDINDPALRDYLAGKALRKGVNGEQLKLVFSPTGIMDAYPISFLSVQSVGLLEEEIAAMQPGFQLDKNRFRPNFYVSWRNEEPFHEDMLIGRRLQIGENVVIKLEKRDARCSMITFDPETAQRLPLVQGLVAKQHGNCTGVYATVEKTGVAMLNDPVYLLPE